MFVKPKRRQGIWQWENADMGIFAPLSWLWEEASHAFGGGWTSVYTYAKESICCDV